MPSGFHLISAHSVVVLAEKLAERIERRENPFVPETVLVMSYAQRVWLRRFLAEKTGIFANIDFKSPEEFLSEITPAESKNFFASDTLTWRIFDALKKMANPRAGTPPEFLFGLLGKKEEDFFLRASELAALFWRYQSFRPQMICDWKRDAAEPRDADEDFLQEYRRQKNLWKKLKLDNVVVPAEAWTNFLKNGFAGTRPPARIFAFAPSALPRVHAELLEKLAETSEVFLYYHNLANGLWTESESEKKILRERLKQQKKSKTHDTDADFLGDDFLGNELLAAWGKAAKPLAKYLIDREFLDASSTIDEPPPADSLLHAFQREIRTDSRVPQIFTPAPNDRSLRISVAPNPLREMEILRDELLTRFAETPDLKPRDVLVELTSVETYAPFIQAAFENSGIPFSIADRAGTEIFPAAAAFLEMLRVAQGEFRLEEILALFDNKTTRNVLALSEDEASALRTTLSDAGVRWGIDANFRRKKIFGGSETDENFQTASEQFSENNSWDFGLRRLALGYFFGSTEEIPFPPAGASAPSNVAGLTEDAPETIGKIFVLIKTLARLNRFIEENPSLRVDEWCKFLRENFTDSLLETGDGSTEILRSMLGKISDAAKKATTDGDVPECSFRTFFSALERQDWSTRRGGANGMLRGKITFCEMRPMRNIPAKIICIAGLNDGAFPRKSTERNIDLTLFRPQNFPVGTTLWDRTQRDDACLLFLESILAAQDALVLSYVGRDAADGQDVPPCVPLAKLRDFLSSMSPQKNPATGTPTFETRHRLYGFSPEYFSNSNVFFSFSKTDFGIAKNIIKTEHSISSLSAKKSVHVSSFPTKISTAQLAAFFKSTTNFLRDNCFDIAREKTGDAIDSNDPPENPDALEKSQIHSDIFEKILESKISGEALGCDVPVETEFSAARERKLSAGEISAIAPNGVFEEKLNDEFKDFVALKNDIPFGLRRIDDEVSKEIITLPATENAPKIVVVPILKNVFRTPTGEILHVIFGRKNFNWRTAVDAVVAATTLADAFPNEKFSVLCFSYDKDFAKEISKESLVASGISLRKLAEIYATRVSSPPMFFEEIPINAIATDFEFFDAVSNAWNEPNRKGDITAERFIFGDDPLASQEEDLKNFVFDFVRQAMSAFVSEEKKSGKKTAKKSKKSAS